MKNFILFLNMLIVISTARAADIKPDTLGQEIEIFRTFAGELVSKNDVKKFQAKLEWPYFVTIPLDRLPSLKGIRSLYLGSVLDLVASDIKELEGLKELTLSVSKYNALPSSLQDLKSLTKFDIAHAKIGEIPDFIGNMTQLKKLNFHCSCTKSLTKKHLTKLRSLQKFTDSDGKFYESNLPYFIDNLPDELPALILDEDKDQKNPVVFATGININKVTLDKSGLSLPKSLYLLCGLTELHVESYIGRMPDGIASLTKLNKLYVSTQDADNLPKDLVLATSILTINVTHVTEGSIIEKLPKSIEELDLNCSEMREADFAQLPELSQLKRLSNLRNSYGFSLQHLNSDELSEVLKKISARYAKDANKKTNAIIILALKDAHRALNLKERGVDISNGNAELVKAYEKCLEKISHVVGLIEAGKNT